MRSPEHYSTGPHPQALPHSPKEAWWDRQCPNPVVAAFQAGRLLNQLNWHCQLAVLISRAEHRPAIEAVVTKLKTVSQEIAQDAPSPVEQEIDRILARFGTTFRQSRLLTFTTN